MALCQPVIRMTPTSLHTTGGVLPRGGGVPAVGVVAGDGDRAAAAAAPSALNAPFYKQKRSRVAAD